MPPTNPNPQNDPNKLYNLITTTPGLKVSRTNDLIASIKVGDARVAARVAAANAAAANAATPAKHPYELTIKNYKEKKPPLMLSLAINNRKMTEKKTPKIGGKRRRITRRRRRHQ